MKILHRPFWQLFIALYAILYTLILILHGIIKLIFFIANAQLIWKFFTGVDAVLAFIIIMVFSHHFYKNYVNFKPSASFAYEYNDGPWLNLEGDPSNSITINWTTKEETKTSIKLGISKEKLKDETDETSISKIHHLTLKNLKENTPYFYSIPALDSSIYLFKTAKKNLNTFNFVVFGDTQNYGGDGRPNWTYPNVLKQVEKHEEKIDLILHVGDLVDQGNDLRSWHAIWNASKNLFSQKPLQVVIGNHDAGTHALRDKNAIKYPDEGANFDYFLNYKYGKPNNEGEITSFLGRYYSFVYANCKFLMLDTSVLAKAESKNIIQSEIIRANDCATDPICYHTSGQGVGNLNLSACFNCTLLPETSCEMFNSFLDRRILIDKDYGYFKSINNVK